MSIRASALGLLAVSLVACAAQPAAEEATTASGSAMVGGDAVVVESDRLVFDANAVPVDLKTRIANEKVILTADRQKNAVDASGQIRAGVGNPYGFARRAVSYKEENGKVIVMTEPVALDEVFQNLSGAEVVPVGRATMDPVTRSLHHHAPAIHLTDKQLYTSDGLSVKLKSANVSLDTMVDLGADISWFDLHSAHAVIEATLDSDAVVEADLNGPFDKSFSVNVYTTSWPIGSIGVVPVTLGLQVSVACDIKADGVGSASAGLGMNVHVKGGVKYDAGSGTSSVSDPPRFSPRVIPPQLHIEKGTTNTRCALRPQLSIMLFDSAGPTLTPDLAARLEASTPPVRATVTGELGLDVGGRMDIFGRNLGQVDYHLFTVGQQLWSTQ